MSEQKKVFNPRIMGFVILIAVAIIFQLMIDPLTELTKGTGVGRLVYILTIASSSILIYGTIHILWKVTFWYEDSDRRTLLAMAKRTPEGAGSAFIGTALHMLVIAFSVLMAILI